MRGKNASIEQIEFANAFLTPKTNGRQLNIRALHDGSASEVFPAEMKIYLVSGKFMFEPRLANYPFIPSASPSISSRNPAARPSSSSRHLISCATGL